MAPTTSSFLTLAMASQAAAWGALGHTTVAYLATSLLTPSTKSYTQALLNSTSPSYLADIATWADSYRSTATGAFSAPLHYIDALDNPPAQCDVDYARDCPAEGCIIRAIANYTARFPDARLPLAERQMALKWVVHFLGDVHQPLHVENIALGGNQINVTFDHATTNLHHIWDSDIPEKMVGGANASFAEKWAADLLGEIQTGKFRNQSAAWLEGIHANDSIASAMGWASEANALVCTKVMPQGRAGVEGKELAGAYYQGVKATVEEQVARAGVRLAGWLEAVLAGKAGGYGFEEGEGRRAKREVELEPWMVEARRARRDSGWGCGCEAEEHEHEH